jgi:hypothetical protein
LSTDLERLKADILRSCGDADVSERVTAVRWVDGSTGKEYMHLVDLTVEHSDGSTEYVDFAVDAKPLTKYLYAQNQLANWRLVTVNEAPFRW